MKQLYCKQPDHDGFGCVCGYPLPCPWHTATIHLDSPVPSVEIPVTAVSARAHAGKLHEIAKALTSAKPRRKSITEQIAEMERRKRREPRR